MGVTSNFHQWAIAKAGYQGANPAVTNPAVAVTNRDESSRGGKGSPVFRRDRYPFLR